MSGLSLRELNKYEWRINAFVNKFYNNELFESDYGLVNLQALKINNEYFEYNDLAKRSRLTRTIKNTKGQSLWALTELNEFVSSKLKKTAEFGGKSSGFSTRHEAYVIKSLKDQLSELGKVDIRIGDELYRNIKYIDTTKGTPKSDFHLSNIHEEQEIFISHKKGSKAKEFQQYGGISKFYENEEVLDFLQSIKNLTGDLFPKKMSLMRPIESNILKRQMVYGNDYNNDYGINNVQLLIQGEPILQKEKNYYVFKSNHIVENPQLPKGEYEPVLYATYRKRRSVLNEMIKDVRVGVYAKEFRTKKELI